MNSNAHSNHRITLFFEKKTSIIFGFCISKVACYLIITLEWVIGIHNEQKGPPWKEPAVANL